MKDVTLWEMDKPKNKAKRDAIQLLPRPKNLYCKASANMDYFLGTYINGRYMDGQLARPAIRERFRRIMEEGKRV